MWTWLARRLLLFVPLLWVVSTQVFFLSHLIPGDPVDFMIGENAALDKKEELRAALHLDKPLTTQYVYFIEDLLSGELKSIHSGRPVSELLAEKFPMTLRLALAALVLAAGIAIPLGTWAAWRQYSWVDNLSMVGALIGVSIPNFWFGPLLILVFSVELNWLPVSGADSLSHLILPAVTLGLGMSALLTRMTRASVLEVMRSDYITTARAKGAPTRVVVFKHALRNAMIPIITVLGLQAAALLAGSIITEEIFGWPGLGREVVGAIRTRDFPVMQGCVLLIATTYVTINLLVDMLYAWVNPRVRLQ